MPCFPIREMRSLRWVALTLIAAACDAAQVGSTASVLSGITIDPSQVNVEPQSATAFAVLGAASTAVRWSVVEGGGGTIDTTGYYVAPAATGTFHVVATSLSNPSVSGSATVQVAQGGGGGIPTPDCATAALRTTGTTYYYCDCQSGADASCSPGNDSNPGTTPGAPRRSISDAFNRVNSMNAGDTVALCRGGVWSGGGYIQNTRCTAASPCEFRDYTPTWATSSTARPQLAASSGTLLGFSNATQGGFRIWNLDLRNGDYNQTDGTMAVFDNVHDLDVCNVRIEGSYTGMNFQPTSATPTNITVRNSQFYNTGFCGFYGGSPGIRITGNYFSNNGLLSSMTMHSVYLISETGGGVPPDASTAATYTFSDNQVVTDSRCNGVMVVVHGVFRNNQLVIENNSISTTSTSVYCYGMQTAGGLAGAEFHNAIIRRNRISTPGQTAMEFSCCQDCQVSSNLMVNGDMQISTSNCDPGGFLGARVTLQNNTVYGGGLTVGSQGSSTGYIVENNAVWTNGGSCFSIAPATTRNAANYCRTSGGAAAASVFVDAASGNFKPAGAGPLVGTASQTNFCPIAIGSVTWSASDAGVTRVAPGVDIGAFQH